MTDPSTLIESEARPAEIMRQVVAAGWTVTAPRVKHEGSTPKPIFGDSVTLRTQEAEYHGTNPKLARMASGPTMTCDNCAAIGAGQRPGVDHWCGGKWRSAPLHETATPDEYQEVILSDRWRKLKAKVVAVQKKRCGHCGHESALELHHKHYATMGRETERDVVALCSRCHEAADRCREYSSAFNTWHSKKYGDDAEVLDYQQEEFGDWLDRQRSSW